MKRISVTVSLLFATILATGLATAQKPNDKPVVRLDSTLDAFVSADAKLELVKSGFGFTEGALWIQKGKGGYLLFSDIPANVIYKWTPNRKRWVFLSHLAFMVRATCSWG